MANKNKQTTCFGSMAKAILEKQGISYSEWLEEQHLKIVRDNSQLVTEAIENIKNN